MNISINVAKNILKEHGSLCRYSNFRYRSTAKEMLMNGSAILMQSEWLNGNANNSWVDQPDFQKETTYNECVDLKIYCEDNKLFYAVTIFNGHLADGAKIGKRCEFTFELLDINNEHIQDIFNGFIRRISKALIEEEDRNRDEDRLKSKINQVIALADTEESLDKEDSCGISP